MNIVAKIKNILKEYRNALIQALKDKDYDLVDKLSEETDGCYESPFLF